MKEKLKALFTIDRSLTQFIDEDGKRTTLLSLMIPIFLESALRILMGTVNSVILSRFTPTAAGAIGTASIIINFMNSLFSMISAGVTVIIVQNLGAGRRKRAADAASLSVAICGLMSIILGFILSLLSRQLMSGLMNLTGEQLEEAVVYFRIVSRYNIVSTLISVFSAIGRSYGKTRANLVIAVLMNVINAAISAVVVFRPFETPLHGIAGVAVGRVIAETIAFIVNVILIVRLKIGLNTDAVLHPDIQLVKDIIKYGLPSGIGTISYNVSTIFSSAIIGGFGTTVVTAKTYLNSVTSFSTGLGFAAGMATSILIGWNVGKGDMDRAYRVNFEAIKIALIANVGLSTIMAFLAKPIFRAMFHASDEVLALVQPIMFIEAVLNIGRAVNVVEESCLRATGDVVYQMVVGMACCWLCSVLFCYIFGVVFGYGLIGCWFAFLLDEWTRAALYLYRWISKKWMEKRIIKQ
ncbi:MAG: MATE family efflux transporter [Oscillospiraceae bacterium]|nr:MATE family efflux transporter [Oscillospiraceae bacterium]MBQ5340986.1 MATE family efflux transporter [Oscillospiraceae bacterium]